MHILFDSHGLDEFGESEMFHAFCIVRSATEYAEVSLLTPRRWVEHIPSLPAAGVSVIPVDYDSSAFPLNNSLEYMYWLYSHRALRAARAALGSVDLIHRLNPMAVRYASVLGLLGKPFVIGPIGWSRLPPPWADTPPALARNSLKSLDRLRMSLKITRLRRMYEAARGIALGSSAALDVFPPGLREKCTVVGEPINTDEYPAFPPPDNTEPVILYVGRLVPYKGVEYLVDALSSLRDIPWRFQIVGDGPLLKSLRTRVARVGLDNRTQFIGRLPRREVLQYYAGADVCCFPGLNESTGNVNVEAMACGRPLVVADWAGPRDIVTEACGVRVPVTSKAEFTEGLGIALRELLVDPDLRHRMGEAGRQRAVSTHDQAVVFRRYRDLHERGAQA